MNQQLVDPALPVADRPFWDRDYSEDESQDVQTIANSFVLLKSLKQSRERWIHHTFPKFSSRGRGSKATDVPTPPPHTIQNRGRCNLEIGPHIFHDTIFYEVHYLPSVPLPGHATSQPASTNPYWQSTVPYGSPYSLNPTPATSTPSANAAATSTPKPRSEIVSTPLISSLTEASITPITPSLINQVNIAAASNPILANLLQLAAANRASEDQLKTLGLLIQSLANMDSSLTMSALMTTAGDQQSTNYRLPTYPPVKEFDIVIEFGEAVNDRWLIPRGPACAQRLSAVSSKADIDLTICIPDSGRLVTSDSQSTSETNNLPVILSLKEAQFMLWDTISRWIGGEEKMNSYKKYLDSLVPPQRLYLGLQIPSGPLLTQLQAACAPPYVMKPLRQGPAPARQKRSNASRRLVTAHQAVSVDGAVVKRSRVSHSKSSSAAPIQCLSCKQTDVPLIMGGRFCRPCASTAGNLQQTVTQPVQSNPLQ
ncbi:hypothetical protein CPB84DRAFT_1957470 [Gymnopilus junonius]|uniref:Uncharacterized protein n=1 Tax=Gymnopilus junonius TaxID=109634 RepID=A0A9P5TUF5_GYMJU|nr:hypothetical protein CPB84DRAFT_1957470 [Gymnopilus junonius]